ncbi:MAG: hypothetical protein WD738_22695 [Pirellulales bacterium]
MPDSTLAREIDAIAEQAGKSAINNPRSISGKNVLVGWPNVAVGIILAGTAYPFVLAAIYVAIAIAFILWSQLTGSAGVPGFAPWFGALMGIAASSTIGGLIGLVWTSLVIVVTLPIVYFFAWSLNLRGNTIWLGAWYGGLVGFTAVLPFMLSLNIPDIQGEFGGIAGAIALGPGLTTVLGQLGGAWGGKRAVRYLAAKVERHRALIALGWRTDPVSSAHEVLLAIEAANPPRFQFGIRHLLWIAVWLSLLLSVIRLSGIPFEFVLPLLLGWLIYQSATLWIGWYLALRLGPWWRGLHESRST